MEKSELTEGILYRLECIIGFAQNIHEEIGKGLDVTDSYEVIERIDRELADLDDIATEHKINRQREFLSTK